jgi:hypothetical protein
MTIQAYPGRSGGHECRDQRRTGELGEESQNIRRAESMKVKIVIIGSSCYQL